MTARPRRNPPRAAAARPASRHWLLLAHQLPARPSNLRVRTWRRLQQLGAMPVKQGLYVLPDSPAAREDFEWLKAEIADGGGDASVFVADTVDSWSDDALVQEFRRLRQEAYLALAREVERAIARLGGARRRRRAREPAGRVVEGFRERLTAIERVDFFASAGRDRVVALIAQLKTRVSEGSGPDPAAHGGADVERYRGRLWVTRPRPGVDRMASAWLIRRFIDPDARFGFVADREAAARETVPFDMFGVEFTHRGEHCTFETLCAAFRVDDAAVTRLGAIVHDVDLKDGRFGAPEAPTVAMMVDGLQAAYADDDALLAQGMVFFEALYRAAAHDERPAAPRPVAARRQRPPRAPRSRSRR